MISVLTVDDEEITRHGLVSQIDWDGNGVSLLGTAASAHEALELMETDVPDVVILDIRMPEL